MKVQLNKCVICFFAIPRETRFPIVLCPRRRLAGAQKCGLDYLRRNRDHSRPSLYWGTALGITVIYPGTFDPITHGHTDIVRRAAPLFDRLIVAVAGSTAKNTVVSVDERVELAGEILSHLNNVEVKRFDGLMVDFARANHASLILRGLRAVTDFEYEFQLAGMNRKLMPEADTVFLPTSEKFTYISSSLVREIAALGGDISDFVHPHIKQVLLERVSNRRSPAPPR